MKKFFLSFINWTASPFVGKGYVDRHLPFLVTLYEYLYSSLRDNSIVEVAIPKDSKLLVYNRDTHVGMHLISGKKFEPVTTSELLASIRPSSTVFDIGANVGYYSILAGKCVQSGRVYAFEPDKRNFNLLSKNIKNNGLNNVSAQNIAVGSYVGSADFKENNLHMGKSSVATHAKNSDYKIGMTTLDAFCVENDIKSIDVIKLDVEGLETEVLKGGIQVLTASPDLKLFIEYNERSMKAFGKARGDLMRALEAVGLGPTKILDEPRRVPVEYSEAALEKVLRRSSYTNLLCEK